MSRQVAVTITAELAEEVVRKMREWMATNQGHGFSKEVSYAVTRLEAALTTGDLRTFGALYFEVCYYPIKHARIEELIAAMPVWLETDIPAPTMSKEERRAMQKELFGAHWDCDTQTWRIPAKR